MKGVLDGAGFPAVVTAHFVPMEGQQRPRTTILIKFAEEVYFHCFYLLRVRMLIAKLQTDSFLFGFYLPGATKRSKIRLIFIQGIFNYDICNAVHHHRKMWNLHHCM